MFSRWYPLRLVCIPDHHAHSSFSLTTYSLTFPTSNIHTYIIIMHFLFSIAILTHLRPHLLCNSGFRIRCKLEIFTCAVEFHEDSFLACLVVKRTWVPHRLSRIEMTVRRCAGGAALQCRDGGDMDRRLWPYTVDLGERRAQMSSSPCSAYFFPPIQHLAHLSCK